MCVFAFLVFFKQKPAYEMRISDWSSDVCSSDLARFRKPVLPSSARPARFHGRVPREERCAAPGCREAGEFRAPASSHRSPDGPPPYRWLCLDHVREFNAGYNFFAGMDADQIMAPQSPTAGWETESRAFRPAGSADLPTSWADFKDPDAVVSGEGQRDRQSTRLNSSHQCAH